MPTVESLQTSFASGEISPKLFGRVDRDIYLNGAAKIRNMYVTPSGGVVRRPGTQKLDNTTSNAACQLISFAFNTEQEYLLVFTSGEFKVYKDDVLQTTVSSSPISLLTASIISEMDWTQSADTLILVHEDITPIEITRTSDTAWTAANITLSNIPRYNFSGSTFSTPAGSVVASATTGTITLTGTGTNFDSSYVGQYINFIGTDRPGRILVTAVGSTTSLTGKVVVELSTTSSVATGNWQLEEGFEDTWSSSRGWPKSVTFWQQRLWFGGSGSRPQTVWGSKILGFYDFDLGSGENDEAIEFTIDDDQVNAIVNIFAGRTLQVFTTGGEFFTPLNLNSTITPKTVSLEKATRHGSSFVKNISSDGATLFVEASGRVIREYLFLDVEQSYVTDDVSFLAEHLINTPVSAAKQNSSVLAGEYTYYVNSDGTIAVLNRRRQQNFLAWSLFETEGEFERVAVVDDMVYVCVKRTINSATVRFIEKFSYDYYTDCGVILTSGSATDNWTGLSYLEGENVYVRAQEGFPLLNRVVSGGEITTEKELTSIEVGLPMSPTLRSISPNIQVQGRGNYVGRKRRVAEAVFQLYESDSFDVSNGTRTQRVSLLRLGKIYFNKVYPKQSGWVRTFLRGYSRDPYIEVTQTAPLDLHILSMRLEVTT